MVFTHGRGSSHPSVRSGHVAAGLRRAGLGTLLLDLLQPEAAGGRRNVRGAAGERFS
jgi:hypothetical protein